MKKREPIAIVGIGCRLPGGASNPVKLWELLQNRFNAIVDVPRDRWDMRRFYDADPHQPGKMYVNKGGFLQEKIDQFDADFFHISPREAHSLDPQQRLLLEVAWEAFEDGGIPPSKLRGSSTGVFIGAFTTDWQNLCNNPYNLKHGGAYTGINSSQTILSARLSYFFDFKGPCVTLDTACSSSLAALHFASQSLWQHECEMALAGGVNLMLTPEATIAMSKGQFLNPEGYCRSFDANAKGYVRGEGAGIVILKPLNAALDAGDPIYALIKATGINHDGQGSGLVIPNKEAQKQLIARVLTEAGIEASQIQYVEAHGTGTTLGDPIEAWAIDQVLNQPDRKHKCFLGSIKTNIGHLEAAAGIAGVIKAALCLKHRSIPPHLHFSIPNPSLAYDEICLKIPTQNIDFPEPSNTLYAGINSFGYGGTNVHAVLQGHAPLEASPSPPLSKAFPFPFSAKNEVALKEHAIQMCDYLEASPEVSMADLAYTLSQRRDHFLYRMNILAHTRGELLSKLRHCVDNGPGPDILKHKVCSDSHQTAFVFTGMGPQRHKMGIELYHCDEAYKAIIDQCNQKLIALAGWSLIEELSKDKHISQMDQPEFAQPANFAVQAALFETLKSKGIHPCAVIGHSIGEIAAAYASGAITLEEGLYISHHRSRIQASRKGLGTMLAVEISESSAHEYLSRFPHTLSIAAINSTSYITFSGEENTLQAIARECEQREIFYRFLKVNIAYHSYQMDGLETEVLQALRYLSPQKPTLPLYSTVLGYEVTDVHLDANYWWQNIRQPVAFKKALSEINAQTFIEIGPHPVLAKHILECHPQSTSLYTLHRLEQEHKAIETLVGKLYVYGWPLDWKLMLPSGGKCIAIPKYPWNKELFWIESEKSRQYRVSVHGHPMFSRRCMDKEDAWTVEVNHYFFPWLPDHRIDGSTVFPAAAYVDGGIALYMQQHETCCCLIENLDFTHPLVIETNEPLMRISLVSNSPQFHVHSCSKDSYEWVLHATGSIKPPWKGYRPPPLCLAALKCRLNYEIDPKEIYRQFKSKGLEYGPAFQLIQKLYHNDGEALAEIEIPNNYNDHYLPPPVLDSALQSMIATVNDEGSHRLILPKHIDEIHIFSLPKEKLWCYATGTLVKNQYRGDLQLCDADGNICIELRGIICQVMETKPQAYSYNDKLFYHLQWKEVPQQGPCSLSKQSWIIISPKASTFAHLLQMHGAECSMGMPHNIQTLQNLHVLYDCAATQHKNHVEDEFRVAKELLQLVQHLDRNLQISYCLWIITQHHSTPWGLARTLRNENPACTYKVADLSSIEEFIGVLSLPSTEYEIKCSDGKMYAPRLMSGLDFEYPQSVAPVASLTSHQAVELELTKQGSVSHLHYKQSARRDPNPGEVEVQVHTAALNFKDLMKVMGLLDPNAFEGTYFGENFGMEASGTIVKVGKGVRKYKKGDHVCLFIGNTFRSFITLSSDLLFPIPPSCSLEQAPIYIPYITVLHSLKEIARLRRGETLLIHSAAGAVGLAAIQYAKHVGARIIATVGSDEKRQYLKTLGIDLVADSRSLQFSRQIWEWTQGKGVDVILNSLSGDFLLKSWPLLTSGGRFIEIGKRDIVQNTQLPMETFNRNTLFAAVDLDRIFLENKKAIHRLLKQAKHYFQREVFTPPPCRTYPAAQCQEAFQMMAKGQHIGKLLLKMENETVEAFPELEAKPLFKEDATYMVTGGLSGFGLATAKWIAEHGGGHLLLLSRNGPTTIEAHEALKNFKDVKVIKADVGDLTQLKTALEVILPEMPPLKGIFHCAMVLEDALVSKLDQDQLSKVLHPKISGCWNLHQLTSHSDLDYFVLFSSISSLIGNPGQANYAAANAFLDSFVEYRKALDLPTLVLNWGAIAEVGVAARNPSLMALLERSGIQALPPQQALNNLEVLLQHPQGQYAIMDVDWAKLLSSLPQLRNQTLFESIKIEAAKSLDIQQQFKDVDTLKALIKEKIAVIMQIDISKIDEHAKLSTLGVDSLMAMELQHVLEKQIGVKVPTMEFIKGPSISQLAEYLIAMPIKSIV